ncbi:MAG: acetoacetate--CoA ligase, partial [Syntrophobacterales bacterium CG23_combo_of_CG06-09_8_20_14_all_48_27]
MTGLLWKPSEERIKNSNMYRFLLFINERYRLNLNDYDGLYRWSIDHIPDFWASVWDFGGIKAGRSYDQVIDIPARMPGAKWFSGGRLNFAENLLRIRDDSPALVFKGEDHEPVRMTYGKLYDEVAKIAGGLREIGVKAGDRVAGFMPNMPETVVAMLAATSLGAVWSSCSPDFGIKGVLDRFGQIKPKVLFVANGYFFKGKVLDSLGRIASIIKE